MIKNLLAAVLIWGCVFGNNAFAQKENNIWYFGQTAGLDFNSGAPSTLTNSGLGTFEGTACISDSNGAILFYTNGVVVKDRNHTTMPNGIGLGGGLSSTQSALIIPFDGNNILYNVFTVEQVEFPTNHRFNYSIVDMSLNGGNGDVTIRDSLLLAPVSEKLTTVRHSANDLWVMVHGYNNNSFIAYLISGGGILPFTVISNVGQVLNDTTACGYMKFSPDGTKIAFAGFGLTNSYVDLFDFDINTGIVSNEKYLTMPSAVAQGAYGLEFSANGNYLYSNTLVPPKIYQWDITSNNASVINASRQMVGVSTIAAQFGALQMGPDGKIYSAHCANFFLGAINNPDLPGTLCNYVDSAISLNGHQCDFGLPNFITSYFLPTGISTLQPPTFNLQISPNPASDKITISFAATTKESVTIKIYSVTGEVVFEEKKKSNSPITNYQIPVTNLTNGIYFLNVQTEGEVMTKKIVVNH